MRSKGSEAVHFPSENALNIELKRMKHDILLDENEESWEIIHGAMLRLTAILNGIGTTFSDALTMFLKSSSSSISRSLKSDRSRLSGASINMLCAAAITLKHSFEPLVALFAPDILWLASRTSKLTISRSRDCLKCIITETKAPSLLPFLRHAVNDKSASLRLVAMEALLMCLEYFKRSELRAHPYVEDIECVIRTASRDSSADVRKASRKVFEVYQALVPSRVDDFVGPLTPTTRKYLKIQPGLSASQREKDVSTCRTSSRQTHALQSLAGPSQRTPARMKAARILRPLHGENADPTIPSRENRANPRIKATLDKRVNRTGPIRPNSSLFTGPKPSRSSKNPFGATTNPSQPSKLSTSQEAELTRLTAFRAVPSQHTSKVTNTFDPLKNPKPRKALRVPRCDSFIHPPSKSSEGSHTMMSKHSGGPQRVPRSTLIKQQPERVKFDIKINSIKL